MKNESTVKVQDSAAKAEILAQTNAAGSPARAAFSIAGADAERRSTKRKKEHMIMALEASMGVVSTAAKLAHIDRQTHYRWLERDEKYRKRVVDAEELALDFAETSLHRRIKDGDTYAITFLLKTRGKKRGYVERQETTGADGQPLEPKRQVFVINGKEIEF
jgi:hypothetical protein